MKRVSSYTRKIYLVGPLAPPIGGVSSHVYYLAENLLKREIDFLIMDPYFSGGADKHSNKYEYHNYVGVLGKIRIFLQLVRVSSSNRGIIHFHFSGLRGVFVASLAVLFMTRNSFITLHHGELEKEYFKNGVLGRKLYAFLLSRFGRIFALSEKQKLFYESAFSDRSKIYFWGRMPLCMPLDGGYRNVETDSKELSVVMSGMPSSIYQYELAISIIERLSSEIPVRLQIFLYGSPNVDEYALYLCSCVKDKRVVTIDTNRTREEFINFLKSSNLYIRPTLVDSYGLAVVEALNIGVPVVASDVCQRDSRAMLYNVKDNMDLINKIKIVLSGGSMDFKSVDQKDSDEFDPLSLYRV